MLLKSIIKESNKSCLGSRAVMRHFAELFEEDVEKWGIIGLVHDLDYEMYQINTVKNKEILKKKIGQKIIYVP